MRMYRKFAVVAVAIVASVYAFGWVVKGVEAQSNLALIFDDSGTSGNWQDKWFLDGPANVSYTPDGMVLDASPGSGEAVLWAKPIVRGDVRIEYDYTHLDNASNPHVIILFIQASGTGSRPADIAAWQRSVASYPLYHQEMSNYSITYDNSNGNLRARHNPGQSLSGKYSYTDLWQRNETYHMTVVKSGRDFSMTARNIRTGASHTFDFTGSASNTAISEGRIGLRHMDDRASRYRNFKIWATSYVGGGGNTTGATTGGAPGGTTGDSGAGSCLATFTGPVARPNRDFGLTTYKIDAWSAQARYDMTGSKFASQMNGYDDFRGPVPIQFNVDWGTNRINPDGTPDGRRDMWSQQFNTPPRSEPVCIHGGVIVGTQPLNATWGEIKRPGGGYAITVNGGPGTTIEGVRIHNHHDSFVPYRNDGFIFRDNWVSYSRDDCIENDGNAEGAIESNLFDGCYTFISATRRWSANSASPNGAGPNGTLRIVGNLIKMQNMPGPYQRDIPLGVRGQSGYGLFWKTQRESSGIPNIVLRDNIIAFEQPITKGSVHMTGPGVDIVECANNTILWLGSGSYPGQLPAGKESCFTILTGSAAQHRWNQERQRWIDAHPEIPRI